jgi:hypothetical protein
MLHVSALSRKFHSILNILDAIADNSEEDGTKSKYAGR